MLLGGSPLASPLRLVVGTSLGSGSELQNVLIFYPKRFSQKSLRGRARPLFGVEQVLSRYREELAAGTWDWYH